MDKIKIAQHKLANGCLYCGEPREPMYGHLDICETCTDIYTKHESGDRITISLKATTMKVLKERIEKWGDYENYEKFVERLDNRGRTIAPQYYVGDRIPIYPYRVGKELAWLYTKPDNLFMRKNFSTRQS